jgi:hypothetical protein
MEKDNLKTLIDALVLISQFTDEDHKPTFEAKIAAEALSRVKNIGFSIDEN